MKKIFIFILLSILYMGGSLKAQVTTEPSPLQIDSKDVWIYFHADQGNKGLMNSTASTAIYAHTGVITSQSANLSDWKYVVADWNVNLDKCKLQYVSPNLWKLYIGDIRSFYNITDPAVKVEKLVFVFRNSNGSKEGKTSGNGDIQVDVLATGLQVSLQSNPASEIVNSSTGPVKFTVTSTVAAQLSLNINGTVVKSESNSLSLTCDYTFPSPGDYNVIASASAGGKTVETSRNYAYLGTAVQKNYPGGGEPVMGPVTNPDGSVTFCIAAPGMDNVVMVGSWNNYKMTTQQQMNYVDYPTVNPVTGESGTFRYFWTTVGGIGATTQQYPYYFIVSGTVANQSGATEKITTTVGDPYARLILDPYNDKELITNGYPNLPVYPYDMVTGVPVAVYQSNINSYDWKVKNFQAPEQTNLVIYELLLRDFTGTEGKADGNGTVRKAIEKLGYLKKLGVNAIELLPIMEFNGNNSWGYNPNFYFAIDKAYGTPDDYKEFIDLCHQNGIAVILDMVFNQSDGWHPWYVMYGGAEFSPFYNLNAPHAYSVLNDWNQGYPLVQKQWADVIRYWMTEYKFDGFRFDLVKGLGLNNSYANNGSSATDAYNSSRVAEMKYLNGVIKSINPRGYCINENLAGAEEENQMAQSGEMNWANVNYAGCQFAKGISSNSGLERMYARLDGRTWGSTVSYLESHDEQRLAYEQITNGLEIIKNNHQVAMQRLGSAAAQMIMAPGAHMIWMFSEMGNAQNTKNSSGNDTSPKIVNWGLLDNPDNNGLYENYCELIGLRLGNPEFYTEEISPVINCTSSDWSKGRKILLTSGGKELYTLINPMPSSQITMNVPFQNTDASAYKVFSKSYGSTPTFDVAAGTVTIPANCYVVIGSTGLNISDVETLVEDDFGPTEVYNLGGVKVSDTIENLSHGIYIVKEGGKTRKIYVR